MRQSQELFKLRAKRRDHRRELAEKHKQEKEELELMEPEEMEYGSYREKGVSGPGADYILRGMERWQSRS